MFTTKDFDEMKAMLKAELKAELAAEFNKELQNLRQDVEKLRATLRAPPNDDVADVKDAVPDRMQDAGTEKHCRGALADTKVRAESTVRPWVGPAELPFSLVGDVWRMP